MAYNKQKQQQQKKKRSKPTAGAKSQQLIKKEQTHKQTDIATTGLKCGSCNNIHIQINILNQKNLAYGRQSSGPMWIVAPIPTKFC